MITEKNKADRNEMIRLINELHTLIDGLPENPNHTSLLEIDIAKDTLRKLYHVFNHIATEHLDSTEQKTSNREQQRSSQAEPHFHKKQTDSIAFEISATMNAKVISEAQTKSEVLSTAPSENVTVLAMMEEAVPPDIYEKPAEAPAQNDPLPVTIVPFEESASHGNKAIENKTIELRMQQVRASALFEEPSTLAGKYAATETIGDKITRSRTAQSIGEKLQGQPLLDLKKSIGINERYAFINELFEGNQQAYHDCIEQLNKMNDFEEATHMIQETLSNKLQQTKSAVRLTQFIELIKRRFDS